jgi:transcriptional regulator with XRE-family HTH domain
MEGRMGRDTVPGFGPRVRELREKAGLSQTALAQLAGTHYTTVAKIETEERAASFRLAIALAGGLGVSVADLVPPAPKKGRK